MPPLTMIVLEAACRHGRDKLPSPLPLLVGKAAGCRMALHVEAVVDFGREPACRKLCLHALERRRGVLPENALGGLITGKRASGEIVGPGITDILGDTGVNISQIDEPWWERGALGRALGVQRAN